MITPHKMLLRRGEVVQWVGISSWSLKKLVATNTIRARQLIPGGRLYFYRDEILELISKEKEQNGH